MPFAFQLQDNLLLRNSQIAHEFAAGESLETVLGRYLLAVESAADTQLLTSTLLLDEDCKHLWHGAAPSLPKSYCEAIDGMEIGPNAGSCGSAAYLGRAIYVSDIAADPLWNDYRELAAEHGLCACWSTPIRGADGAVIGTFAVYHLTPRGPTPDEIEAIRLITGHVAQAIEWAHDRQDIEPAGIGHLQ
jgi:GAF domain-containing protein